MGSVPGQVTPSCLRAFRSPLATGFASLRHSADNAATITAWQSGILLVIFLAWLASWLNALRERGDGVTYEA